MSAPKLKRNVVDREIIIRYKRRSNSVIRLIFNAQEVYDLFAPDLELETRENLIVVYLDPRNYMLGWHRASIGTFCSTIADTRNVFIPALKANAAKYILIHNHVNMDCEPSKADIKLTKSLKRAGNMLGLELHDHVIIGGNTFYSFREENIL